MDNSLIKRQDAIDEVAAWLKDCMTDRKNGKPLTDRLKDLPSAQPLVLHCTDCEDWHTKQGVWGISVSDLPSAQSEQTRVFVELVVEYLDPDLCPYKEYRGKPYYSIKYIENGETYVGYGTYNPEVLSQYLREYFMPSAQPEIIRCKDCEKYGTKFCAMDIWTEEVTIYKAKPDDFCSRRAERQKG